MKTTMKTFKVAALAAVLLTACQKDSEEIASASADQTESISSGRGQKVTRPFQCNLYTTADNVNPATPCTGDLPGLANPGQYLHGTASHLGQVNSSLSRLQDINCNLSFATALLTTHIGGELVAANGDKITFTGDDEINVYNLLTGSPNPGTITGVWTITGGTGRFAGATGSFTINGPVDFVAKSFSFTGSGTITY